MVKKPSHNKQPSETKFNFYPTNDHPHAPKWKNEDLEVEETYDQTEANQNQAINCQEGMQVFHF